MRKLLLILSAALFLVSCGPSRREAADYNDRVIELQRLVIASYDALLETYDNYVPSQMDKALHAFEDQIDNSQNALNAIPVIAGGEGLKAALSEYFDTYRSLAQNESRDLVRLYKVPENEFTSDIRVQWDAIYKVCDDKAKSADKKLRAAQQDFADSFGLTLNKVSQ